MRVLVCIQLLVLIYADVDVGVRVYADVDTDVDMYVNAYVVAGC